MNRPRHRRTVPRLEVLEPRDVPATFTVTTTADSGPGSFADALAQAEATTDPDTIAFAVTGTFKTGLGPYNHDLTIQGPGASLVTLIPTPGGPGSVTFNGNVSISGVTLHDFNNGGHMTLTDVDVAGGLSGILSNGTLGITDSVVENNGISDSPLYLYTTGVSVFGGTATITNTIIRGNTTFYTGGGLHARGGTTTLVGCTFSNNRTGHTPYGSGAPDVYGGGAVYAEGSATVVAENCTFSGNSSALGGGAILIGGAASVSLLNCTVAGNSAVSYGGGIGLASGPPPVLRNTIVAGNILPQAGQPNRPDDYTGSLGPGSSFDLIGANPAGPVGNGQNGNQVGTVAYPIDPMLGPLQDNGGPTPTHAPLPGSPAIDAGDNAAAAGLSTDQRGGNFVRVANGTVDIGAVEVQPQPPPPPPPPPAAKTGAILAGGPTDGTAVVLNPTGGVYAAAGPVTFFPGFGGTVRVATADVNGDGVPDYIGGAGPGGSPAVVVIDGKTGATLASVLAFESSFTGGVFVAAGDLNGDGRAEVVVTPDRGGGPNVVIFSPNPDGTLGPPRAFFALGNPGFRGGARVAVGDLNGDGVPDLAVGAGFLGGPNVEVHDGKAVAAGNFDLLIGGGFFAFDGPDATTLRNGVFLAIGDLNGDGFGDLIAGGGPGGGPRVLVLSGKLLSAGDVAGAYAAPVANFFFGSGADRGGVRVATTKAAGDSKADLVVGSGEGLASKVRVYLGKDFIGTGEPAQFQDLDPFGAALPGGVFVG
jgi:hypothetical protein